MHELDKLKEKLCSEISNSELSPEEKKTWKDVFSALADYQDDEIKRIAAFSYPQENEALIIQTGITSRARNSLKNFNYISVTDDISDDYFAKNKTDTNRKIKMDGDRYIIGTGYLDCSYEQVIALCGREHSYKGISPYGEFSYSLVLQNNILHQEKIISEIQKYYHVDNIVMYAPMLRRLVYIETTAEPDYDLKDIDFRLSENGLSFLKVGWRSVWNVECTDKPFLVKNDNGYRFERNHKNEFIIPKMYNDSRFQIKPVFDKEHEKELIFINSLIIEETKEHLEKINVISNGNEISMSEEDIITYIAPSVKDNSVTRIFSMSDVAHFLSSFKSFVKYLNVYTEIKEGFVVCSYERGFEYLLDTDYFLFSERPILYVEFEYSEDKTYSDRVIYVANILQKRFPEYIWKGGYCK